MINLLLIIIGKIYISNLAIFHDKKLKSEIRENKNAI